MRYHRGQPNPDGTITWSTEQLISIGAFDVIYSLGIGVDTTGHAHVSYRRTYGSDAAPWVIKNNNTDGTWSTAAGYPLQLHVALEGCGWGTSMVTLTGNKMYILYWGPSANANYSIFGKLYDGSSYGPEELLGEDLTSDSTCLTCSASVDDVLVAWAMKTTRNLVFKRRIYGSGWQSATTIYANTQANVTPYIIPVSNGDLCVLWGSSTSANPEQDKIVYSLSTDLGITWNPHVILVDETTDLLTDNHEPNWSASKIDYGVLALCYITKTSDPRKLRYVALVPAGWTITRNLKSGFYIKLSRNLKASMFVTLPTTRFLKSKFFLTYDYIKPLNRSEVLFEGKTGYVPAYFYRNRTFSGEFTIKCEAEIYSDTDNGGGAYVCSFSNSVAPIASMFGHGTNDLAIIEIRRNGVLYEIILSAEDAGGSTETSAPLTISSDTTYYLQLSRSGSGDLELGVYSDPEFSIPVGILTLPSPHLGEYTVLYAVDGKGYTGAPSPFPDGKVKVSKMRVVKQTG